MKTYKPQITPSYIPEVEVPCRNIEHSFWRDTFNQIPEGQALVLKGEYARKAYEAMRKFKSRGNKDWVKFEAVKRRETTYIIHYSSVTQKDIISPSFHH